MNTSDLYNFIVEKCGKGAEKLKTAVVLRDIAINTLATMFKWDGLPEKCLPEFAEQFNIIGGNFALWEYDGPAGEFEKPGDLIFTPGGYADRPTVYGFGSRFIANTLNGYVKTLTPGIDCVICHNNSLYAPDMPLILSAVDLLTESFTSLRTNVIYSRLKPVFRVSNDTEKAAVENAFKSIRDDLDPIQITSKNVLADIEGEDPIKVLDITDVNNADKIQYIVKAIDDIMRWIYTLYGQAIQGNGKLAQQSVDEVEGSTSTSFILPNDRLKMRRRFCDEANTLFGLNLAVDFSEAWKVESVKYKKEADIDQSGEVEELDEVTAGDEEITETTAEEVNNEEILPD